MGGFMKIGRLKKIYIHLHMKYCELTHKKFLRNYIVVFKYKNKRATLTKRPAPFEIKSGIQAVKSSLEKALISQRRQFKIIKINKVRGMSFLSNLLLYA